MLSENELNEQKIYLPSQKPIDGIMNCSPSSFREKREIILNEIVSLLLGNLKKILSNKTESFLKKKKK